MAPNINKINTDLLVIGAGIAGFTAALKALERYPGLHVTMITNRSGPSGSSFANANRALGIQICFSHEEKDTFVKDAISIAGPGTIIPELVGALVEKSPSAYEDLKRWGAIFRKKPDGGELRIPGCFSPNSLRAFILEDIAPLYHALHRRFIKLGGTCRSCLKVRELIVNRLHSTPKIAGVWAVNEKNNALVLVSARAVIVALGGTAPLFRHHISEAGTTGIAPALFHHARAALINLPYHQFLWYTYPERDFFKVHTLAEKGGRMVKISGELSPIPSYLHPMARSRSTHAPIAYGLKDAAIDHFVMDHLTEEGWVEVVTPDGKGQRIIPLAHAGNGGARIDHNGMTTVQGLYACGECAGGMHVANRIGGAMILSAMVFGGNAGQHAADSIHAQPAACVRHETDTLALTKDVTGLDALDLEKERKWVGRNLHRALLPGRQITTSDFRDALAQKLETITDFQLKQLYESAKLLVFTRSSRLT